MQIEVHKNRRRHQAGAKKGGLEKIGRRRSEKPIDQKKKFQEKSQCLPYPKSNLQKSWWDLHNKRAQKLEVSLHFLGSHVAKRYPDGESCDLSSIMAAGSEFSFPSPSANSSSALDLANAEHSSTRRVSSRALSIPALANTD